MAIFKNKTGRGEVDYAKAPVQSADGTIIFFNDHLGTETNVFGGGGTQTNHLIFQLRGNSGGVDDVSNNRFSVTESSSLTKRIQDVNHTTRLKTFEFSGGKTVTLTPKLQEKYQEPGSLSGNPRLGRDQSHGSAPIETIIPATVIATRQGDGGVPEVIISFWLYVEKFGEGTDGGGSCIMEQVSGNNRTFGIVLSSEGELVFRWYDWGEDSTGAEHFQQIKTQNAIAEKQWYHITIFVKGGAGDSAGNDNNYNYNTGGLDSPHQDHLSANHNGVPQVEIFIDGNAQKNPSEAGKTSGAFTGTISSDPLFPVVLGTGLAGLDNGTPQFQAGADANFNGRLAEVSYFYTTNLNRNLHNISPDNNTYRTTIARALMTGKDQPTSGISNVSERLIQRELDESSSRPATLRSGDQRRLGNTASRFFDDRAQTLKGSSVQYPTKLVADDRLIDSIYSGYHNGNLIVNHTASVDSYSSFYRREDKPRLDPFVESRLFVDDNSTFYQNGTPDSVLPGFDQPLKRKSAVVIDVSPRETTMIASRGSGGQHNNHTADNNDTGITDFYNSAVFSGRGDAFEPMCYWNKDTKRWDRIGVGIEIHSTASGVYQLDYEDSRFVKFLNNATIGFSAGNAVLQLTGTNPFANFKFAGRPTTTFGFPAHPKYHATASQCIPMSDYISEPFLVEKIRYDFSAGFDVERSTSNTQNGHIMTFAGPGNIDTAVVPTRGDKHHGGHQTQMHNFFMLLQREGALQSSEKISLSSVPVYAQPCAQIRIPTTYALERVTDGEHEKGHAIYLRTSVLNRVTDDWEYAWFKFQVTNSASENGDVALFQGPGAGYTSSVLGSITTPGPMFITGSNVYPFGIAGEDSINEDNTLPYFVVKVYYDKDTDDFFQEACNFASRLEQKISNIVEYMSHASHLDQEQTRAYSGGTRKIFTGSLNDLVTTTNGSYSFISNRTVDTNAFNSDGVSVYQKNELILEDVAHGHSDEDTLRINLGASVRVQVKITATGTPDQYQVRLRSGSDHTIDYGWKDIVPAGTNITAGEILLHDKATSAGAGVDASRLLGIRFNATTGHSVGDTWEFYIFDRQGDMVAKAINNHVTMTYRAGAYGPGTLATQNKFFDGTNLNCNFPIINNLHLSGTAAINANFRKVDGRIIDEGSGFAGEQHTATGATGKAAFPYTNGYTQNFGYSSNNSSVHPYTASVATHAGGFHSRAKKEVYSYDYSIPTDLQLVSGSDEITRVSTTRTLLTYGTVLRALDYLYNDSNKDGYGNDISYNQAFELGSLTKPSTITDTGFESLDGIEHRGLVNEGLSRDLNIIYDTSWFPKSRERLDLQPNDAVSPYSYYNGWFNHPTGSFVLEAPARAPKNSKGVGVFGFSNHDNYDRAKDEGSGRRQTVRLVRGISSTTVVELDADFNKHSPFSRHIVSSVTGDTASGSIYFPKFPVENASGLSSDVSANIINSASLDPDDLGLYQKIEVGEDPDQEAPFLLLPTDKIVLGWQPDFGATNYDRSKFYLHPHNGSLVLYGSFLKNGQPKQFQLNQLLTNDVVNESIGSETIHDQWDIEPRSIFTGSYADEFISGSVNPPLYAGFDSFYNLDIGGAKASPGIIESAGDETSALMWATSPKNYLINDGIEVVEGTGDFQLTGSKGNGETFAIRDASGNLYTFTIDNTVTMANSGPSNKIGVQDATVPSQLWQSAVDAINHPSNNIPANTIRASVDRWQLNSRIAYRAIRITLVGERGHSVKKKTANELIPCSITGSLEELFASGDTVTTRNRLNTYHFDEGELPKFRLARRVNGRASENSLSGAGSLRRFVSIPIENTFELDSYLFDVRSAFKQDDESTVDDPDADPSLFGSAGNDGYPPKNYGNDVEYVGRETLAVDQIIFDQSGLFEQQIDSVDDSSRILGHLRGNRFFRRSFLFDRFPSIKRVPPSQTLAGNNRSVMILTASGLGGAQAPFGAGLVNIPVGAPTASLTFPSDARITSYTLGLDDTPYDQMKVVNPFAVNLKSDRELPGTLESLGIFGDMTWLLQVNTIQSTNNILFGIGDGIQNGFNIESVAMIDSDLTRDGPSAQPTLNLSKLRGFRYGLSGTRLRSARAVFRRNSYGQFRDLLEMAPNTAYIDERQNIFNPVEVQFFADDGSVTQPENTASSNLSTNCTSSAPFFDREIEDFNDNLVVRNRGPINNQVADITIEI